MKKLVLATKNPAKFKRYSRLLNQFDGLNILSLADFDINTKVEEPFSTAEENAEYKAKVYVSLLNENVLAVDEALYVDFLPDDQQPGVHVRRIVDGVTEESDDVIFNFWKQKIDEMGGVLSGYWRYALCIYSSSGKILSSSVNLKFIFETGCNFYAQGYPMSALCKDADIGKVYAEMSEDEKKLLDFELFDDSLRKMIDEFLSKP